MGSVHLPVHDDNMHRRRRWLLVGLGAFLRRKLKLVGGDGVTITAEEDAATDTTTVTIALSSATSTYEDCADIDLCWDELLSDDFLREEDLGCLT